MRRFHGNRCPVLGNMTNSPNDGQNFPFAVQSSGVIGKPLISGSRLLISILGEYLTSARTANEHDLGQYDYKVAKANNVP